MKKFQNLSGRTAIRSALFILKALFATLIFWASIYALYFIGQFVPNNHF